MAFSRRIEERRQQREAARRTRALERRQDADRQDAEEERRREEAANDARALEAELAAADERRQALVLMARATRRIERRDRDHREAQRQRLLDTILQARRADADLAEARRLRHEELLDSITRGRAEGQQEEERQARSEDRAKDDERASRKAEPPDRPDREATSSRSSAAPRPPLEAERSDGARSRLEEDRDAPSSESDARASTREEQRARAAREARDAERRETRQRDREAAAEASARQQSLREEARESRLAERREAEQATEAASAAREAAQRERQDQRDRRLAASQTRRERAEPARPPRATARVEQAAQNRERRPERDDRSRPESVRSRPEPSAPSDPLTDRIPSGVLSASLPWLTTQSNRVITIAGEPVVLRGVSLIGLDGAGPDPARGYAAGAGITDALLDQAIGWGANVVRVAINRRRVLAGADRWTGWDYLNEIDDLVRRLAQAGAYTLLSLRRLDDSTIFGTRSDGSHVVPNEIAPQPDFDAIGMWRLVAEHYADEPAVLFDLYTAPRQAAADDLTGYRSDWDLWTLWVQMTVADVRQAHPRALCFVAGLDDGTDLTGLPIPGSAGDPIPNLVYAAHLTSRRSAHWPAIRALARRQPVFVTEWGGSDSDVTWGERTALALRAEGLGWTAAHWNADPPLVNTLRDRLVPTKFGVVVQRAFALSAGDPIARAALPTV